MHNHFKNHGFITMRYHFPPTTVDIMEGYDKKQTEINKCSRGGKSVPSCITNGNVK
jgi:hypothetical protein